MVHVAAEVRSFERAEKVTEEVLGQKVSVSTIRRVVEQVGGELAAQEALEESSAGKEVPVPQVAVVSCDGGRIRTRQAGMGRGVCLSGENGWRETKNASLERMERADCREGEDPCGQLPSSFRAAAKVADLAEKAAPNVAPADGQAAAQQERVVYRGPRRILRTVLSSMMCSHQFGRRMAGEARRRRFYDAPLRAFLGDGQQWNWSIWREHFRSFVPILDFVHAIQYLYAAAMAEAASEQEGWATYLRYAKLCWEGQVAEVIEQLRQTCKARGIEPDRKLAEDDPRKPLLDALRYLSNNRSRMDYPRYRRLGLPVTSAPMESLIKQINLRVKGTEMFWLDPHGAEAILHVRAAALCEDGRLSDYLRRRPGSPFVRRPAALNPATLAT